MNLTQLGTGDGRTKGNIDPVHRKSEGNALLAGLASAGTNSNPANIKSGTLDSSDVNMSERGSNPFMPQSGNNGEYANKKKKNAAHAPSTIHINTSHPGGINIVQTTGDAATGEYVQFLEKQRGLVLSQTEINSKTNSSIVSSATGNATLTSNGGQPQTQMIIQAKNLSNQFTINNFFF